MIERELTFAQAIKEALTQTMAADPAVYIMGEGVPDPKGIFGTTLGLREKFGTDRVLDMPLAENGMTGVAIGSALAGMRPVLVHQRVDFALLAMDQMVNTAAKWHYMFGGKQSVPIVIRMVIGRGWGQGPQHSQSLQAWFAHVPGLKVVMPTTPYDAKGLLISAIEDNNPVIFLEHRWLHRIFGPVPEEMYRVPLGQANTVREGKDLTIVSTSYMTLEALRSADLLSKDGIEAEIIDVRSLKPLDTDLILESVRKTGRLIAVDGAWKTLGFASEVLALVAEEAYTTLKCNPKRIAFPDVYAPSSPAIANPYYPRAIDIINTARTMMGLPIATEEQLGIQHKNPLDVPDTSFTGPF
jgi:pyruvate/2-oxoglutarate/acetoin dehydrogenase E1 component